MVGVSDILLTNDQIRALYGPIPVQTRTFRGIWEPVVPWCLAFKENLYGPTALKVCQKFPPRLVLVHGWLFPEIHMLLATIADGKTAALWGAC